MSPEDQELEEALEDVVGLTESVSKLRSYVVVAQLLRAFKASKRYKIDFDTLSDEVRSIDHGAAFDSAFDLDGDEGLQSANVARASVRAARDSLIEINRGVRKVLTSARRVYRIGSTFLRAQPETAGLNVKSAEDLMAIALREVTDVIDGATRLMDEVKEALVNLDDKSRTIEGWFSLHKQYVFWNYARSPHERQDPEEKPSQVLGRRTRG